MATQTAQLDALSLVHQQSILQWAKDTFKDAFDPSIQTERLMAGWSTLLNAKRKRFWNLIHPEDLVELDPEEAAVVHKIGLSVQSGHGLSKTATLAMIALHFMQCFPESRTLVTAPAGPQLFTVIWPEFYKWIHLNEFTRSAWRWNAKQISPAETGPGGDHWIRPRTIDPKATSDEQGETLAGLHARQTLRVIDEASAVPDAVMLPFEGGLTDPIALIAIGYNPTKNTGFAIETQRAHRERWLCYHLDAEEIRDNHPFWYNPQVQIDLEEAYGRDSNFYRVRVRGLPPLASPDTLIPWEWVMEATERDDPPMPYDPIVLGIDVAGEGGDRSIGCVRHRNTVLALKERRGLDTMQVAWWAESLLADLVIEFPEARLLVGIDSIGIGKGVYDYLRTVKGYKDVFAVNVSRRMPPGEQFFTLRDKNYWAVRAGFESGLYCIPKDDGLIGELTAFKWSDENAEGKIKIEDKRKMRSRLPEGKNSPDKADAFMIADYVMRVHGKNAIIQSHEERRAPRHRRRGLSSWKTA